jgi:hypothetical protein
MVSSSLRRRKATEGIDEGWAHVPARVVGARYNSTPIFSEVLRKVCRLKFRTASLLQMTRGVRIVAGQVRALGNTVG